MKETLAIVTDTKQKFNGVGPYRAISDPDLIRAALSFIEADAVWRVPALKNRFAATVGALQTFVRADIQPLRDDAED